MNRDDMRILFAYVVIALFFAAMFIAGFIDVWS
jgi:hypothetical protein